MANDLPYQALWTKASLAAQRFLVRFVGCTYKDSTNFSGTIHNCVQGSYWYVTSD